MKNIFKNRRFKYGSLATGITVAFVAAVVLVNVIVGLLVERFPLDIDLTENQIFELTDDSIDYLKGLEKDVVINVLAEESDFAGTNAYYNQANEVIKKYAKYSSHVTVNYVDIYTNPDLKTKYPKDSLSYGGIVVECGDRHQTLTAYDIFNTETNTSGSTVISSSKAEQAMTSAIMFVTDANPPTVAVITGFGTSDVSGYTSLLTSNGYLVEECSLMTEDIPEEADIVILAAPTTDFSEEVLQKLDNYLDNNGTFGKKLFYFADWSQPTLPNLEAFLEEWGIDIGSGYLYETDTSKIYFEPTYVLQQYESEVFTEGLSSTDYPVLIYGARPMSAAFESSGNRTTEVLLKSYDSTAIIPNDADEDFDVASAEKKSCPTVLAGVRTQYDGTTPLRSYVVAFAAVSMVDESFLQYAAINNADYTLNVANYLCDKEEGISIVSKTVGTTTLGISTSQANTIGALFQFVLPVLVIAGGIVIWARRRNR